MAKVLIATVYGHAPVMRTVTKFGVDKLILLSDPLGGKDQQDAIDKVQKAIGEVVKIEVHQTEVYDIIKVAKKCVELLDRQDEKDEIIVNVSSGRKPKMAGLLFACYARPKLVKKIVYVVEETNDIITFPKLSFQISESACAILENIERRTFKTIEELARKTKISRPMIYRHLDELIKMDLIERTDEGYIITDAGRIVRL
jgi:CRISPR locus-related DNA-binding protein